MRNNGKKLYALLLESYDEYVRRQEFELFVHAVEQGIWPFKATDIHLSQHQDLLLWYLRYDVVFSGLRFELIPKLDYPETSRWTNSDWYYHLAELTVEQFNKMPAQPICDNIVLGEE